MELQGFYSSLITCLGCCQTKKHHLNSKLAPESVFKNWVLYRRLGRHITYRGCRKEYFWRLPFVFSICYIAVTAWKQSLMVSAALSHVTCRPISWLIAYAHKMMCNTHKCLGRQKLWYWGHNSRLEQQTLTQCYAVRETGGVTSPTSLALATVLQSGHHPTVLVLEASHRDFGSHDPM